MPIISYCNITLHRTNKVRQNTDKSNTVHFRVDDRRYGVLGLDEPLARDSGVVHAGGEVAVGGDNFGFGPVVWKELGLLAAGR